MHDQEWLFDDKATPHIFFNATIDYNVALFFVCFPIILMSMQLLPMLRCNQT